MRAENPVLVSHASGSLIAGFHPNIISSMAAKTFALCSCYFTHNVFLQRYRLHCVYYDTQQFGADYREVVGD